jgi:Skp family chaperone for outer membrane proteins
MKKLLLLGLLALAFVLPAHADLKVALIDTSKAFDAFYKTKLVATRIAAKRATFEKEVEDLQAEYATSRQQAQELERAAGDTSLPITLRKSKDVALAQKVQELKSMDDEMEQMRKSRTQEMKDDLVRSHQEIADEILRVIVADVATRGYDLVLDNSSVMTFPYNSVKITDLTPEIIAKLNASAPSR